KWFGIGEAQINLLNNSEYLMVCGKAEQRGNEVQAKITYAEAYDPNGTESEYQPLSFQPLDFLQSSLDSYIDSIKDPDIKELLRAFFVYDQQ
ncbi:hypothetical protein, partial [Streptomyces galilaeus]|uniref:hypothetical protein n=1 Tax=Streptomyces galilaeus TaxID=33899 RepID=UPI0038F5FB54